VDPRYLVGPVLGILIGIAVDALLNYLTRSYLLIANVYNFNQSSSWRLVDNYGVNEQVYNGSWQSIELPPMIPDGKHCSVAYWTAIIPDTAHSQEDP
jgi:hypothetical protein